jgi:hypothetical protein
MNNIPASDYLLTIQIRLKAPDDPGARQQVSEIRKKPGFYMHQPESTIKLQRIHSNKPPRKVNI